MPRSWARWFPWLFFGGITALIVYPWFLQPGYLFLLDFVWTPQVSSPLLTLRSGLLSSVPYQLVFWLLNKIIPAPLLQKIAFSLPLWFSGASMFHLMKWVGRQHRSHFQLSAALIAGIFYMSNAFVVTRYFMGQYFFLLAYALTPWIFLAGLRLIALPTTRRGLVAGLALAGGMITNAHHVILLPLLLGPYLLQLIRRRVTRRVWLSLLTPLIIILVAMLALYYRSPLATRVAPDPTGPEHRLLAAPFTHHLLLDTVFLTANWKADLPYLFPYELTAYFGRWMSLLLIMMAIGGYAALSQEEKGSYSPLIGIIALSIFLSLGLAHPWTRPGNAWLYSHLSLWTIMRDSGKFMALVALGESMLLGRGVLAVTAYLSRYSYPRAAYGVLAGTISVVALMLWPAIGGFYGQIYAQPYPDSWYEIKDYLDKQPSPRRVLFLPWHMYMPFSFSDDRTITNPAPLFFDHSLVVASKNSEVGKSDQILFDAAVLKRYLREQNIQYVMLATDTDDADAYSYLSTYPSLQLVLSRPEMQLWQTKIPTP